MELVRSCCCLAIIVATSCALAEHMLRVDRFTFEPDDHELIISNSARIEHDGNRSYLSGHLEFSKPLDEITFVATMDIARSHLPRVRLFDSKMDLCRFFNNAYKSKFLQQFQKTYVSFINVRPRCPLQAHVKYILQRAYVDEHMLPDLLPECSYFLNLTFWIKAKPLATMRLSGQIAKKVATSKIHKKA